MSVQGFVRHPLSALHPHAALRPPRAAIGGRWLSMPSCGHESLEVTWDETAECSAYRCPSCGRRISRDDLPEVWRVWRP